jgi:hypothetical protein
MSTSRQTNGAHGCLMFPQKVRLKVEQLFARHPRGGLVLTYKYQTLRLAWAWIHLNYQSLRTFDSRKRVYLIWIQFKTVETLWKKCYPPSHLATLTKWRAMCNRHDSCQQICQTNIQKYICQWDSAVWLLLAPEVVICGTSSILWFFIWGVCPINWTSLNVVIKYWHGIYCNYKLKPASFIVHKSFKFCLLVFF